MTHRLSLSGGPRSRERLNGLLCSQENSEYREVGFVPTVVVVSWVARYGMWYRRW